MGKNYIQIKDGNVIIPEKLYNNEREIDYIAYILGYDLLNDVLSKSNTNECDITYDFCNYLANKFIDTDYYKNERHSTYEMLREWVIDNEYFKDELLAWNEKSHEEKVTEIEEKPTYIIKVWETEELRDMGESSILETGFIDMGTAVDRAKKIWQDNDFASIEVQTGEGHEKSEVIYFCDSEGESYMGASKEYIETHRENMIKIFKLYHTMSPEITSQFGGLYIVHEIEYRFKNNPEWYDRFSQADKETIFEQVHEAWIQASSNIGSYQVANAILDAVIDGKISIKQLSELSSSDVLDIAEELYDFEELEDEEEYESSEDDEPLSYEEIVALATGKNADAEYEPSSKDLLKEHLHEQADLLPPDMFDKSLEEALTEVDEIFEETDEEDCEYEM